MKLNRPLHLLAFLTVFAASGPLRAADPLSAAARQQIADLDAEKEARTPAQRKMDSALVFHVKKKNNALLASLAGLTSCITERADGCITLEVTATVTDALRTFITANGGQIISDFPAYDSISIHFPANKIENLAARSDVRAVQRAIPSVCGAGTPVSEGVRTHAAATIRNTYGVDGTGLKIGVISDGVDSLARSKASGNLNAKAAALSGLSGSGDEGTAMMEIVQDILPGAEILFAGVGGGTSDAPIANSIDALRQRGCSVIVDDVLHPSESPFQETASGNAVRRASDAGVLYFSSAANTGNLAHNHSQVWQGNYADGGVVGTTSSHYHQFSAGTNELVVTVDSSVTNPHIVLFWAEANGSAGTDYDLWVKDSNGNFKYSDQGRNTQSGSGNALESIVPPSGTPLVSGDKIIVINKSSPTVRFMHLAIRGATVTGGTNGSIRGHNAATAANAFCIAATNAANSPAPSAFTGGATNPVENFSCDGPRRAFFNFNGTTIVNGSTDYTATGGQEFNKPDFTAADGVRTSLSGFSTFFGTSAAAPHAAAIAALVRAYNPTLTPAQIRTLLEQTALNIEDAANGTNKWDRTSGHGIVMAQAALAAAAAPDGLALTTTNGWEVISMQGAINTGTPPSSTYTLTNNGATTINWSAANSTNWTALDQTAGVLSPGQSVTIACSIVPAIANTLPVGSNLDTLTFTDLTSGFSRRLSVSLVLQPSSIASVNLDIPNGSAVWVPSFGAPANVTLPIGGLSGTVTDVSVSATFYHPASGDVELVLISPNGTEHVLTSRVGATNDFGGTFIFGGQIFYDYHDPEDWGSNSYYSGKYNFIDSATTNPWSVATGTLIPAGNYRTTQAGGAGQTSPAPTTSLNTTFGSLTAAQANGNWTLRFRDVSNGYWTPDTGTISGAELAVRTNSNSVRGLGLISPQSTNETTLSWLIGFTSPVAGLTTSNFSTTVTGVTASSVTSVTSLDGGLWWIVKVTYSGTTGTVRLNLANSTGITPAISTTLPVAGQVCTFDQIAPVTSVAGPYVAGTTTPLTAAVRNGTTVDYVISYPDTDVELSTLASQDITVTSTGNASAANTVVTAEGTGNSRRVSLSGLSGSGTLKITVKSGSAVDKSGNFAAASSASSTFTVDNTAPTVSDITALQADGTAFPNASYNASKDIYIAVKFSEKVKVTAPTSGSMTLTLNSSSTNKATYDSGGDGSSDTLKFKYTVGASDSNSDLDCASAAPISLGTGGLIRDLAGNDATLSAFPIGSATTGALAKNKDIVIDNTAPTVSDITALQADGTAFPNGSYKAPKDIYIAVKFSEKVKVTAPTSGSMTLTLNSSSTNKATYDSGGDGSSDTLKFKYTVGASDSNSDLDCASAAPISLGTGGLIHDLAGNDATLSAFPIGSATTGALAKNKDIKIDNTKPTILSVTTATDAGSYKVGTIAAPNTITINLNLSEACTLATTGNAPTLALGSTVSASYDSVNSTSTVLAFKYTIAAGDNMAVLDAATLTLGTGTTLRDPAGNDATTTLPSAGAAGSISGGTTGTNGKTITIDNAGPTVSSVTSLTADGSYGVGGSIYIKVIFNESISVVGTPSLTLNTVPAVKPTYFGINAANELLFLYVVAAGQNVARLNYAATTSLALGTGITIKDLVGNAAILTLPALTAPDSLGVSSNIKIDTTPPVVTAGTALVPASQSSIDIVGTGLSLTDSVTFTTLNAIAGTVDTVNSIPGTKLRVNFATQPQTSGVLKATVTDLAGNISIAKNIATIKPVVTPNTSNILATPGTVIINGIGFDPTPSNNTVTLTQGTATMGTPTITGATTNSLTVEGLTGLNGGALNAVVASKNTPTATAVSSGTAIQVANVVNDDATLKALTVSSVTLSTAFSSSQLNYNGLAPLPFSIKSVTVTPTANRTPVTSITVSNSNPNAQSPTSLTSVSGIGTIGLGDGMNEISITVVAPGNSTPQTYVVNVYRNPTGAVPVVVTSAAVYNAAVGTQLKGTVDANSADSLPEHGADAIFEWGWDTSYGHELVATPAIVTGTAATTVVAGTEGIGPGTFHYRMKAISRSTGAWAVGSDQTFTTYVSCTTNPVTNLTNSKATLSGYTMEGFQPATWTSDPTVYTVAFEYGLVGAAYGSLVVASPSSTIDATLISYSGQTSTLNVSGLVKGQTYRYRIHTYLNGTTKTKHSVGHEMTFTVPDSNSATTPPLTGLTIGGLSASGGALIPEFSSNTYFYAAVSGRSQVVITPTTASANTRIHVNAPYPGTTCASTEGLVPSGAGITVPLTLGLNLIPILVWDADQTKVNVYQLSVTCTCPLAALSLDDGSLVLDQPFDGDVTSYNATTFAPDVKVYAFPMGWGYGPNPPFGGWGWHGPGTVTINGVTVAPSPIQQPTLFPPPPFTSVVAFPSGSNSMDITVVANGVVSGSTTTYTIHVTRQTPIWSWRTANGLGTTANSSWAGDSVSFKSDGISNLFKYGMGLNPQVAYSPASVMPQLVTGTTDPLLTDRLAIQFTLPATPPDDVLYSAEAGDGNTWTTVAQKRGAGAWSWLGGGTSRAVVTGTTVEIGDSVPSLGNPCRMMRLNLTALADQGPRPNGGGLIVYNYGAYTSSSPIRAKAILDVPVGDSTAVPPFVQADVFEGLISPSNTTLMTPTSGALSWTVDAFAPVGGQPAYYMEILSGPFVGQSLDIVSNTANTFTVDSVLPSTAFVSPANPPIYPFNFGTQPPRPASAQVRIRKHVTLDSLTVLNPSLPADAAITLYDSTGTAVTYTYSSGQWIDANSNAAGQVVIYPGQGFALNSTAAAALTFAGTFKTTATVIPLNPGINLVGPMDPLGTFLFDPSLNLAPTMLAADSFDIFSSTSGSLASIGTFFSDGTSILDSAYVPLPQVWTPESPSIEGGRALRLINSGTSELLWNWHP